MANDNLKEVVVDEDFEKSIYNITFKITFTLRYKFVY